MEAEHGGWEGAVVMEEDLINYLGVLFWQQVFFKAGDIWCDDLFPNEDAIKVHIPN